MRTWTETGIDTNGNDGVVAALRVGERNAETGETAIEDGRRIENGNEKGKSRGKGKESGSGS